MAPAAGPSKARTLASDFAMAFMWVCSGPLVKMFVFDVLGMGARDPISEIVKCCCSITNMFLFALLGKVSGGGSYNPLNILSGGISGDFARFLYVFGARIPAQVIGSISGVRFMIKTFPEIGLGPRLQVQIHHGALTEGLLTFAIVTISLALARNTTGSFFIKTWISSVMKITLHILGSDLTGGCMNPASVMGWAYARGDHLTKDHIFVYWLAPVGATLLAGRMFKLFIGPNEKLKKSE